MSVRERVAPSGGARLAVTVAGSGPAVVLLHAGVADGRMWARELEDLSRVPRTAVAWDRRGFGRTTSPDEPFAHVADLVAVLDALELERATLVGCSQGGRVAIDAALAHPGRVEALVLVGTAVSGAPEPAVPAELAGLAAALEEAEEAEDLDRVNALEARLWLDGPAGPEARVGGAVRELFLAMNGIALASPPLTREREPPPAWDRLEQLALPVLLVHGDLDVPWVVERHAALARRLPHARSVVVEGTAHLVNLERPDAFGRHLAAFLGD